MEALQEIETIPSSLEQNEILLVWRSLDVSDEVLAALRAPLSTSENATAARYHFTKDRRRSVVSRGTLRSLLGGLLACEPAALEIVEGAHGKPALRGDALHFNVSHDDAHVLIGVARDRAIGVDTEGGHRNLDVDELAPSVFTDEERTALARYNGNFRRAAFLRGWTRKEAYLKARSVGLSLPLKDFSVSFDEEARLWSTVDPSEAARFRLRDLPAPSNYAAAVCWSIERGPLCRLRVATLGAELRYDT